MYNFFTEVLWGKEVALWAIQAAAAFLKVRFWSIVIHRLDVCARQGWGEGGGVLRTLAKCQKELVTKPVVHRNKLI